MALITRELIQEVARSYANTPFHHCGRLKGVGVDCIGLVAGVAQELGLTFHDLKSYSRFPDGVTLCREFDKCLLRAEGPPLLGDVLVFWIRRPTLPTHAAIVTDAGMIHTYESVGKVVEHAINETWSKRLYRVYRYPGIGEERQVKRIILPPPEHLAREERALRGGGCCGD